MGFLAAYARLFQHLSNEVECCVLQAVHGHLVTLFGTAIPCNRQFTAEEDIEAAPALLLLGLTKRRQTPNYTLHMQHIFT